MLIGQLSEYKGFVGSIEVGADGSLFGTVELEGVDVQYTATSVEKLSVNFHQCVDLHLDSYIEDFEWHDKSYNEDNYRVTRITCRYSGGMQCL